MKKKLYEKPSMEVFKLRQETALLAGSDSVTTTMDGEFTEHDASREIDFEDLSTLMGK
jgi:hypothetical protein